MAKLVVRREVRLGFGVALAIGGLLCITSENPLLSTLGAAAVFSSAFILRGNLKTQADREELVQILRTSRKSRLLFSVTCLLLVAVCVLKLKSIMLGG
jgi:uncharacterized membrane protein HdeD (DUF308 family)